MKTTEDCVKKRGLKLSKKEGRMKWTENKIFDKIKKHKYKIFAGCAAGVLIGASFGAVYMTQDYYDPLAGGDFVNTGDKYVAPSTLKISKDPYILKTFQEEMLRSSPFSTTFSYGVPPVSYSDFTFNLTQEEDVIFSNVVNNTKIVKYWELPWKQPEESERGKIIEKIINGANKRYDSEFYSKYDGDKYFNSEDFHKWVDEKNRAGVLKWGSLEYVLELTRDYLRENREYNETNDEYICGDYSREFILIFNDIKNTNNRLKYIHAGSGFSLTKDDGSHSIVKIFSTDGKNLFVGFVDPTWADSDYIDADGHDERFDATDNSHYLPLLKENFVKNTNNEVPVVLNDLHMIMKKEDLEKTLNSPEVSWKYGGNKFIFEIK